MRPLLGCLATAALLFSAGCLNPCGNEILSVTRSPDRNWRAVVFERSCGATTGFSTHVSVLAAGERLPNAGGNVFAADFNHGPVGIAVTARWDSSQRMVINYPARARILHREFRINNLAVAYQPE